jgi:hypothetical protein
MQAPTLGDFQEDALVNDLNPGEFTAAIIGAGTVVASVGLTTTLAPQFVVGPTLTALGAYALGHKKRHGHLPFMGKKDQAVAPTTPVPAEVTPAPVAAPQPGAVTDASGTTVNPEDL